MDNPEKPETQGTQDEEKQSKNTECVGHHNTRTTGCYYYPRELIKD